jgi:hypothetical protein
LSVYILLQAYFLCGREDQMGKVLAEMSMSLDGYVAEPDDGVGALHGWYVDGEVEAPAAAG